MKKKENNNHESKQFLMAQNKLNTATQRTELIMQIQKNLSGKSDILLKCYCVASFAYYLLAIPSVKN